MRALPAVILIALVIAAAVIVAEQPGSVDVALPGWQIHTSIGVMALACLVAALVFALVLWLLRRILGSPRAFMRARREKRRRDGYRALTQGMVAVAAGDAEEALKLARKADGLLAEPPLTLLLSAQAAQLNGDEQAARRYFTAMLERRETEFLGLRGLIMQALRGGDEASALHLTERARALRPRTPWVLASLFELQARAGHWSEAETTLVEATKRKALPGSESQHRRAVLLHEESHRADAEGQPEEALRLEAKAARFEPGFAPIAARHARLLGDRGQIRAARKAIEAAWRVMPHPLLADAYRQLFTGATALERLKHMQSLAALRPGHIEGLLALARAALDARLWGEARRYLQEAGAQENGDSLPQPRVCRLMAELEEAENDNHASARAWHVRASGTEALDPAYVCECCGAESPQWTALCPRCRSFDRLVWRESGRAPAPLLPAATITLTPSLPMLGAPAAPP